MAIGMITIATLEIAKFESRFAFNIIALANTIGGVATSINPIIHSLLSSMPNILVIDRNIIGANIILAKITTEQAL